MRPIMRPCSRTGRSRSRRASAKSRHGEIRRANCHKGRHMKLHESTVVVFGGSGFIGSHLVAQLAGKGARIIVPTRRYERAKHLIFLPKVEVVEEPEVDAGTLHRLLARADIAVNVVGILNSKLGAPRDGAPYNADFARAHVELPRRIVAACAAQGVRRYIHMSAL